MANSPHPPTLRLSKREVAIRDHLEAFLASRRADALATDPIRFPRSYTRHEDREVAALLAAIFSYGNVKAVGVFLAKLFAALGPDPTEAIRSGRIPRSLPSHRFQTEADVRATLLGTQRTLQRFGSLESGFASSPGTITERLEGFALSLRTACKRPTPGLHHLFPLPSAGSACKRWWMFLRWVVRPDEGVDLGLWASQKPSELQIPVDTHVARIARALGLTERGTPDGAFSREVTAALARLCPEDPVRYDFALAHMGILGACPSRPTKTACNSCGARSFCAIV